MIQPPIGAQGQGYHSCSRAGDLSTFGWPVPAHHSSDPTRKSPSQCTAAIFIAERNGGSPQLPYLGPPATAVPEFILVPSAHCHHLGHDPPCTWNIQEQIRVLFRPTIRTNARARRGPDRKRLARCWCEGHHPFHS